MMTKMVRGVCLTFWISAVVLGLLATPASAEARRGGGAGQFPGSWATTRRWCEGTSGVWRHRPAWDPDYGARFSPPVGACYADALGPGARVRTPRHP
jgi:hypothetical protein